MTCRELRQLIQDVQRQQSELDNVEVKCAQRGTPRRIYEALSAFANRTGGGVILFGLDERHDFSVVGVGDSHRVQEELAHCASNEMEPPLRPEFVLDEVESAAVLAAVIPEVSTERKPCYYKQAGLPKGAYLRVGNTNRQMSDYEVFGYLTAHSQPTNDEDTVTDAKFGDLDEEKVSNFLDRLRKARPSARYLDHDREKVLARLRILRRDDAGRHPTLAGLLTFGRYPQEFFPQLMITFVHYYGTSENEKTPRGERFVDNRRFEGPISDMLDEAETYILGAMRKAALIDGLYRRDIPEYPPDALREALANAVAHRDYSSFVRGSHIEVKMFADRLEIQSPGGLFGNVNEDNLEEEHSTRNARLMRALEDTHVVENRGSGINAMVEALRDANLEPPRFDDRRTSFRVTFKNHTLMTPEATEWLNHYRDVPLNDQQRKALVYLRNNRRITNSDYRRLNRVDAHTAGDELHGLAQTRLVDQHGVGRGTFYRLSQNLRSAVDSALATGSHEEKILAFLEENGSIDNSQCRSLLSVDLQKASYLLKKLRNAGALKATGSKRYRKYVAP